MTPAAEPSHSPETPSPDASVAAKPRGFWRWVRRALVALVLVVGLAYLLRNVVVAPLALRASRGFVASELGLSVEIESVRGSWWGDLELEGVEIVRDQGTFPLAKLEHGVVRAEYSLSSLLRGDFNGLRALEVTATDVEIDIPAASDEPTETDSEGTIELPARLPAVLIDLQDALVRLPDGRELGLTGIRGRVEPDDSEDRVHIELPSVRGLFDASPSELAVTASFTYARETGISDGSLRAECAAGQVSADELAFALDHDPLARARGQFRIEVNDIPAILGFDAEVVPAHRVELSGSLAPHVVDIETGEVDTAGGTARIARGRVDLGASRLEAAGTLAFDDLSELGRLFGSETWSGQLEGAFEVEGPFDAPVGEFDLSGRAVVVQGFGLGETRVRVSVDGERVVVENLESETDEWGAELSGAWSLGAEYVVVDRLRATRGDEYLDLAQPARVHVAPDLRVEPLELSGALGTVRAFYGTETGLPTFELTFEAFHPMPLLAAVLPPGVVIDGVDGRIVGDLSNEAPVLEVDLALARVVPGEGQKGMEVTARGRFANEHVTDLELIARSGDLAEARVTGAFPLDPTGDELLADGALEIQVEAGASNLADWIPAEEGGSPASGPGGPGGPGGSLSLRADLTGTWSKLIGELQIDGREVVFEGIGPATLDARLQLDEVLRLAPGTLRTERHGDLDFTATLGAPLDLRRLMTDGSSSWLEAPLEAHGDVSVLDVGWIAEWTEALRRFSGQLTGKIDVGGTLGAPELVGGLHLTQAELRTTSELPALTALEADVTFAGQEIVIERVQCELAAAPLSMTGKVILDEGEPRIETQVSGTNVLLARADGVRVRGNVELGVSGALSALRATGEVVLTEGRFTKNIAPLGGLFARGKTPAGGDGGLDFGFAREGPLAALELDLEVHSASPFKLKNNLINGAVRPDLTVTGTGAVPILDGPVYVDRTRLSLPSGNLWLESGAVLFRKSNPFVPALEIGGSTRILGYRIQVQVSGDMLEPEVQLSSVPPLPNDELLVLLLTGQLPEGSLSSRSRGASQTVAVYLAQDFFSRWLSGGETDDEETLLDRLEIETGSDLSRGGVPTSHVAYRLSRRPKGTGRTTYLTGERDAYDKVNFGYRFVFRFD